MLRGYNGAWPMELLLARHGECLYQVIGERAGWDSPLTERGREQARHLGAWLADRYDITACYTSPLQRARETAELVCQALGLPAIVKDDLREADFYLPDVMPRFDQPTAILADNPARAELTDADYIAFKERVLGAMREILTEKGCGTVLVVAHGGTIGVTTRVFMGAHRLILHLENTGLNKLSWRDGHWYLEYVNQREHLLDLGLGAGDAT